MNNAFVPFSRAFTIVMAAVVCFGLIVPQALRAHQEGIVVGASVVFALYLGANVWVWMRMRRRA